jgi:hypothetical protein
MGVRLTTSAYNPFTCLEHPFTVCQLTKILLLSDNLDTHTPGSKTPPGPHMLVVPEEVQAAAET